MTYPYDRMLKAYNIGVARSRAARAKGSQHLVGWKMEIEQEKADGYAAIAEDFVAWSIGGEWLSGQSELPDDGVDVKGPDGVRYGVRWTPRPYGRLIVRPKDDTTLTMVLVVGLPPNQEIKGQIPCLSAMADCFWREDSWWVPQHHLAVA